MTDLDKLVVRIFNENRKVYGCRKIAVVLKRTYNRSASKNTVRKIMKKHCLISVYNLYPKLKHRRTSVNSSKIGNILNRRFSDWGIREAVVSDLTYIRIDNKWMYLCTITDLCNREIIGASVGPNKNAKLVKKAFQTIKGCDLRSLKLFHTDRGTEFDNELIDEVLETFGIERSLSQKGCPYDNAVAETTFKTIKKELIYVMTFRNLNHFKAEIFDYIHWYNNKRIHGALNFYTPNEIKKMILKRKLAI